MAPAAANDASAVTPDLDHEAGPDDGKYRKLLHLFRFSKPTRLNKGKSRKKSEAMTNGGSTPEERRSQLDRDMRRSWDSLPETLRRRRQRVSRDLLCQFVDPNKDTSPDSNSEVQELSRTAFFFDDEDEENEVQDSVPVEIRTKVMLHHDEKDEDHAVVLIISDSPDGQKEVVKDGNLNLEEMEAVELLARAVSSDSLLGSNSSQSAEGQFDNTRHEEEEARKPKVPSEWPFYEVIENPVEKHEEPEEPVTPMGSDAENPYTVMEFENATLVADSDSTEEVDSLEGFDAEETELASGRSPLTEELPVMWASALRRRASVDRRPVTMETIAEEPAQDDSARLTVREILQKFEELGGRGPPEMADTPERAPTSSNSNSNAECDSDEKASTLKDIQDTLQSLEEKVRNGNASSEGPKEGLVEDLAEGPEGGAEGDRPEQLVSPSPTQPVSGKGLLGHLAHLHSLY